ncbi:MAG: Hpt domain-containing protein, partial [Defluviitaleaceae bacterium]|nr:Hpt domain-containing protein [Defluviitaleaceae bacterium]
RIVNSLRDGDTKTAYRIAHTLKSSSGFLGKRDLQNAALSLESSLHLTPPVYTKEQLNKIKYGLEEAFLEFKPIVEKAESEKFETVVLGDDELKTLLGELRELLTKGDFGATDYVKKLQGIAGMEELAEKIDDYEFTDALQIIDSLV